MGHWWKDKNLVQELENRSSDLKTGKDHGISWEEIKKEIKESHQGNNSDSKHISPNNEPTPKAGKLHLLKQ